MDEFIFTQFSCAKYGVLDLLIEYTKKIDFRINGGYIYNITIVNSANGNKAHMVIVQKIILPYEYRSLSNKKIKEIVKLQLQHSKELCDELAIAIPLIIICYPLWKKISKKLKSSGLSIINIFEMILLSYVIYKILTKFITF